MNVRCVNKDRQNKPSCSIDILEKAARLGKKLEKYYRMPLEVEWCIGRTKEGTDEIYILQARPLTGIYQGGKVSLL